MPIGPFDKAVSRYRELNSHLIIETAEKLERRVAERFPDSGLRKVAGELVILARDLAQSAKTLGQPNWWLRGPIMAVFAAASVAAGTLVFAYVDRFLKATESVEGIEASINTILLTAIGLLALMRLEERHKRQLVFRELHGLRSLIHVIDMHQLTKDPAALSSGFKPTANSPDRFTDSASLARYLDYCSEMLSITGKLAALFAQSLNDDVIIRSVNEIEELGSNLSRKIWQKITMIESQTRR